MPDSRRHSVELFLPLFTQTGDGQIALQLALQRCPMGTNFMPVKAIHDDIMMRAVFTHQDGLRKTIQFQRFAEQAFFWRCHIIRVVIVGGDLFLFYPKYTVDRLFTKGAEFMNGLTERVDGGNFLIFRK
ncbi:hypothetical protein D3C85_1595240 [compost metagenome]